MSCRFAAAVLGLAAVSCSQRGSPAVPQRIAILRFENLSAQPSLDWMGRAFAEIVSRELAFAPGLYAIPPSRLHSLDAAFGKDPAGVPGISSERALAVAANANRLGYGEYWLADALQTKSERQRGIDTQVFVAVGIADVERRAWVEQSIQEPADRIVLRHAPRKILRHGRVPPIHCSGARSGI